MTAAIQRRKTLFNKLADFHGFWAKKALLIKKCVTIKYIGSDFIREIAYQIRLIDAVSRNSYF